MAWVVKRQKLNFKKVFFWNTLVNNLLDCSFDCVSKQEFYNEPLNETIEMDRDFAYWKMPDQVSLNHIWS